MELLVKINRNFVEQIELYIVDVLNLTTNMIFFRALFLIRVSVFELYKPIHLINIQLIFFVNNKLMVAFYFYQNFPYYFRLCICTSYEYGNYLCIILVIIELLAYPCCHI